MRQLIILFTSIITLTFSSIAHAYIGPGAGLGAIGTVIALLGALLLMIVGFVWYPLKRLRRRRKQLSTSDDSKEN